MKILDEESSSEAKDNSQKTLSQSTKTATSTLNATLDCTSSDGEELEEEQTFELKNRYNSKIARALWFTKAVFYYGREKQLSSS
ncbi:hypothetical protein BpHYR1_025833 [Brachionus plicatilis]|uniref:Uncharacterized protein n=1 Tax=Brachionus plicatilis TaxID=10195 RepID=A0A3M7Q1C9_BRAPC|nr:hypothetical protein BpHYR1_025833 [Brachionus plicatilis]